MMTLRAWLISAAKMLNDAGRDAPRTCADVLARSVLRLDRTALILQADSPLSTPDYEALAGLLARRLAGEPLAYIIGSREFFGREFFVNAATLIPRPETEHLVETVLECFPKDSPLLFADFGTGSGCIAVTLAAERPLWRGVAVDRSCEALRVAHGNAARYAKTWQLLFVHADMHDAPFQAGCFDCIVSNPPYVSHGEYAGVEVEVRHEPETALMPLSLTDQSEHGLESLEALIGLAKPLLRSGGWLMLEHGATQAQAVRMCFLNNKWRNVRTIVDLSGNERLTIARNAVA